MNQTPPLPFSEPTTAPANDPPVVVTLSLVDFPAPKLMEMRRALITSLCIVEDMLGLPQDKRAIRTRSERRGTITEMIE